jgi:23S rRNA (guanosine2251-2'-O)-methyltransferase
MKTYVVLHNVRSVYNVGSVFRTADGAGVSKIFLTGYTPAPVDRFGRVNESMRKTALGAMDFVPWESREEVLDVIAELTELQVDVVAVEQHERALDYRTWTPTTDTAFVFGNEVDGVPSEVCDRAHTILHIPMYGKKESLNVSVSAGVMLFHTHVPRVQKH